MPMSRCPESGPENQPENRTVTRRTVLKTAGAGLLAVAGGGLLPGSAPAATDAAAAFVDERRISVAQLIVAESDGFTPEAMEHCGFALLAKLAYLFADVARFSAQKSQTPQSLQFVPHAGRDQSQLARVVEQTYHGTLDCPRLDKVRA
ncbi:MAG TPA: twin-arginine translocation signal domain-containing protein, partial [Arenibaculum sp.]|nr:twin-arginine translocation signal domain-containing protein [Arenibaculum sp.]